jgi:hypothetical protein
MSSRLPPPSVTRKALIQQAHWIYGRRQTAKAFGFPFSEETVTETILLNLASGFARRFHIIPFNKAQEGKIGADWEWCIYDDVNHRYLQFLVQAKVLDNHDKEYAHIDRHIGNTTVRQIDRLAQTSHRRNVPAIYAFYNHLDDPARIPTSQCACSACQACWGASVAPLSGVKAALPDKSFDTLSKISFPWKCLLCSASGGASPQPDIISGAAAALNRLQREARDAFDRGADDWPNPIWAEPRGEPPEYLRALLGLARDRIAGLYDDEMLDFIGAQNLGVDGIVLIDASLPGRLW